MTTEVKEYQRPAWMNSPVYHRSAVFNAERDSALVTEGTHFTCQACLVAVPLEKQSPKDSRYCVDCQKVLDTERAIVKQDKDGWVGGYRNINGKNIWQGSEYHTGGKRYIVLPSGETVCAGRVRDGDDTPQPLAEPCAKTIDKGNTTPVILAHPAKPVKTPPVPAAPPQVVVVGRPRRTDARVFALADEGLPPRKIAATLEAEGIRIGWRTVYRMLARRREREKQGVLSL